MKAKDMFEELGYKLQTKEQLKEQKETFNTIRYLKENSECIDFYTDHEQILACVNSENVMALTIR